MAVVAYVAYRFACLDCAPAGYLQFIVLGILPIVYLVLMYLTLRPVGQRTVTGPEYRSVASRHFFQEQAHPLRRFIARSAEAGEISR